MLFTNRHILVLACSIFFLSTAQAAEPLISNVSGSGPHPLGTTSVQLEISTDVSSNCRLNDIDDGNPSQWSTLLNTSNNLNHTSQITLVNDTDTTRYIYCRNLSTGEVNQSSFAFNITFAATNNTAPTITSNEITSATEGLLYNYDVDATDAEDPLTLIYSLVNPPSGMTIDENTGLIDWMPTNDDVGDNSITILVTDSEGLTDSQAFSLNVANTNNAPIISTSPVTTANENSLYTYNVDATDSDLNDTLTYMLAVYPAGMTIDPTTGIINWTPNNAQIGDQAVEVNVTDLSGASDQQVFTVTVSEANVAPVISSTPLLTATEDALYDYDVDATDDNTSDLLTYGLIAPPAGMSINNVSGLINWTPTNAQVGVQSVTVIVTDQGGLTATQPMNIAVTNVNGAPVFSSEPILSATTDVLYSYDVDAVDEDVGDILSYSLLVSPTNMVIDDVSGLIEWTPTASDIGNQDITIQVTDVDGLVVSQSFVLAVSASIDDVGPVRTYVSGAGPLPLGTTSVTIEIETDVNATCRLNNIDDNNPIGWTTQLNSTNGTTHTSDVTLVNDEDTTRYIICKDSSTGVVNGIAFEFNIAFEAAVNQAPTISGINDQTISESSSTSSLGFTIADAETATNSLTVTSSSSDLVLIPVETIVLSGSDASRTVVVTPAANESGSAVITLTVSDGELTATESFVVTVTAVNDAPTITAINDQTIDEDGSTVSLSYSISDTETEATSLIVTSSSSNTALVPSGNIVLSGSGPDQTVIVTPAMDENGSATITLTVSDGELTSEESFVVTVSAVNDIPTITAITDQTVTESSSTNSLNFTVADQETTASNLIVTSNSNNTSLVPVENIALSGSGADRAVIITPIANNSGTATITLTVSDGELTAEENFIVTVTAVNDTPTITLINNQTINEDTDSGSLAFTVGDEETTASNLTLTRSTSNIALVPLENIVLSGTGASRTVVVTPLSDESGSATITLTVSDDELSTSTSFQLTVTAINDAPTISAINDQTVSEDTTTAALNFTVADVETGATNLIVTASSSNTVLVPTGNIVLSGSDSSRTVVITPAPDKSGSATITLTVSDGILTSSESFVVTVTEVNDLPTITSINNQTINQNVATGNLSFTVSDVETSVNSLTVTGGSDNTTLVPSSNIALSGSGEGRTVVITPAANEHGNATITLTVTDGSNAAQSTSFQVIVNAPPTVDAGSSQTVNKDVLVSLTATATDIDGSIIEYAWEQTGGPTVTQSGNATDTLTFTAPEYTVDTDLSFSVSVTDDSNQTASDNVTVTVLGVIPDWAKNGKVTAADDVNKNSPVVPANVSVGALEGQASVSGGAAVYTVPVALPPGRAGMQPNISLNYSSRGGNGIVGVGWSLNAGSAISRCGQTAAQDGFTKAVTYSDTDDRLCLDGQRLIVVSNNDYGTAGAVYRTEIDSFVKVEQFGSIAAGYFKVTEKNGMISRYGLSNTNARHIADGQTVPLSWAINDKKDSSGNQIDYEYNSDGEGEYTLNAIHYTGLNGVQGDRHIRFEYESRNDFRTSYLAGGKTRTTLRLKTISTEYQTNTIRTYNLLYDDSESTGRTLLKSIEECSGNSCLDLTSFKWYEGPTRYELERVESVNQPTSWEGRQLYKHLPHADYNGDGVKDWPEYITDAEGNIKGTQESKVANCYKPLNSFSVTCLQGDFDNDGKTDEFKNDNGFLAIKMSSTDLWKTTEIVWEGLTSDFSPSISAYPVAFSDFNGDGWIDIAFFHPTFPNPEMRVYYHTKNKESAFTESNSQLIQTYSTNNSGMTVGAWGIAQGELVITTDIQVYGDMDGNGLIDFVVFDVDSNYPGMPTPKEILLNQGGSENNINFVTRSFTGGFDKEPTTYLHGDFFADVNGDGLTDWLTIDPDSVLTLDANVYVKLNKGTDFEDSWRDLNFTISLRSGSFYANCTPGGSNFCEPFFYSMPIMSKIMTIDYDGDGRTEFLRENGIVASICQFISGFPSSWRCDDQLNGKYRASEIGLFQDIDSNNLDNSVRSYEAIFIDESLDGTFTSRIIDTDIIASASQYAVIDAYGNGLSDIVTMFGCRWDDVDTSANYSCRWNTATQDPNAIQDASLEEGVYMMRNKGSAKGDEKYLPIDLLKSVNTGLNVDSNWDYRPLGTGEYQSGDALFYDLDHSYQENDDDYFHFASSMYAVASFKQSDGIGGQNETLYRYEGAMYNNKGRGFQGFRQIVVENVNQQTKSITQFHQKFPKAGKIDFTRTCLITDLDDCLGSTTNETKITSYFEKITANAGSTVSNPVYWVVPAETIETSFDLITGNVLSQKTVTVNENDLDDYGNVQYSEQLVDTGLSKVLTKTTNVYDIDEANWWINKLNSSTVNIETTNGSALWDSQLDPIKELKTVYIYDSTHRKVEKATVTPLQGDGFESVLDTVYNSYGLPTSVTTTSNGESRTISTSYSNDGETKSDDGYFVYEMTNDLGYTVTTTTYPEHGQAKTITDTNGLMTQTAYDPFGRIEQLTPPVGTGQPAYSRFADCSGGCDEITSITPTDITGVADMASLVAYKLTTYTAGAPESTLYKDKFNRVLFSKTQGFDGSPIFTRVEYDNLGRKRFESIPSFLVDESKGVHHEDFDEQSRLLQKKTDEPGGQSFTVTYTYTDHLTAIDAVGTSKTLPTMYRTYNGIGQLMKTTDALGGVTEYAYDAMGNPIVLQDANSNAITAEYNALGQKKYVIDPNMGRKDFTYTGFGEVDSETDANGDTYSYIYDALGRLTSRSLNSQLEASFEFDTATKGDTGGVCYGAIEHEIREDLTGSDSFSKTYGYDAFCRPLASTTTIDGASYTQSTQYDSFYGRVKGSQTVTGLTLETLYNDYGYATRSQNAASGYIYQEITDMNARLQLTEAKKANGVLNEVLNYTHETGQMESIWTDTVVGGNQRHRINYEYDDFGNLSKQTVENLDSNLDVITSVEDYLYDDLHRLTNSSQTIDSLAVAGNTQSTSISYSYDAVGNIKSKDDFGYGFVYGDSSRATGNAGPNAVISVNKNTGGTAEYAYDFNGNMTSGDGKTLTYNAFNKPLTITKNSITSTFSYGSSQMRYKQVKKGLPNGDETTRYIGNAYEEITQNGVTKKRSYLGDTILTETIGGNDAGFKIGFVHRDRLNSTVTITNQDGNVVDNKSFDPFGKPREGTFKRVDSDSIVIPATLDLIRNQNSYEEHTNRGFTDHEHLDDAELIHMNGRVYDYNLGRFLSVDPFIQSPGNSQSMNPYSYIMNNPLAGTDPSGYAADEDKKDKNRREWEERKAKRHKNKGWVTISSRSNGKNNKSTSPEPPKGKAVSADELKSIPLKNVLGIIIERKDDETDNVTVIIQTGGTSSNQEMGTITGIEGNKIKGGLKFLARELSIGVAYGKDSRWRADVESQADIESFEDTAGPLGHALIFLVGMRKNISKESAEFLSEKTIKALTKQQQRSIRSLEKQIAKHEKKLQEFKDNPTVRPGMEKLPKDVILRQQQTRMEHLETEIKTFVNNIEKIITGEL